jgi:hypothetical protein
LTDGSAWIVGAGCIESMMIAMAWQPHTVRGFCAGIKKRRRISMGGLRVPAIESGAKSETVYHIVSGD